MISIEEAWSIVDECAPVLESETVLVHRSSGRVLAEEVRSVTPLPPFDQSAMDGIVVHSELVSDIADETPATLPISHEIAAGKHETWPTLEKGKAARIFTGAPVPAGDVTVIPRERVEFHGDGTCSVEKEYSTGANIRRKGEEIAEGTTVLEKGARMTSGTIASASMAGVESVVTRRRPRIAILTTGDEVIEPGSKLAPGQVYDANQAYLRGWAQEQGLEVVIARHVADARDELAEAMEIAAEQADIVVTTGGVSVGKHDHVIDCATDAGFEKRFWKVAQKPGKPMYFATRGETLLFGLPGNPGAVFANVQAFVQRGIDRLEAASAVRPHFEKGVLRESVPGRARRGQWVRVKASTGSDGIVQLKPLGGQNSHMLGNLAEANAVAWVPAGVDTLGVGAVVRHFRLTPSAVE